MALAQPSEEFHQEIQTKRLRPTTVESIRSIKKIYVGVIYIYISGDQNYQRQSNSKYQ